MSTSGTLGILGGGQLAQMMAHAAHALDINCIVYDPNPEACAKNAAELMTGSYEDISRLRAFAKRANAITYEFENVPATSLEAIASIKPIHPPIGALQTASDRVVEKDFFERSGVQIGAYRAVQGADSLRNACNEIGLPAVLKSCSGGYDGKGQFVLHTEDELENALAQIGDAPFIYEAFVPFGRELSIIACRTAMGEFKSYPLTQNTHQHGILVRSEAPASITEDITDQAHTAAKNIAESLDYVGVFAVEFFDVDGTLMANEMAPRVHNSGHWTIEGAATSQFANHVRAVMGMDLGPTDAVGHSVMLNIIGAMPNADSLPTDGSTTLHDYAKEPRPGRKIGHVTVTHADADECRAIAAAVQQQLCNTLPGDGVRP